MRPGDHIRRGGPEDLPLLEPLWVSVHHQHVESMPELAPYVDDAATWAARRALYNVGHGTADRRDRVRGRPARPSWPRPWLYERRGYRPTWLYMSRFEGR